MSQNRLRVAAAAVGLVVAGAFAAAAPQGDKLSKNDKNWVEKEVGAIITAQEISTFEEINKDDRKLFKDLFWMRRDHNPATAENEFQKDYEARVKAADENFRGRGKGSESDMGKIFLLLGGPNQQQGGGQQGGGPVDPPGPDTGSEEPGSNPGIGSPGGQEGDSQTMTWVYDPNPALGIPNGLTVNFRQQSGFGFRLVPNDELTK
ncbi:MAG TPA: GWxTD domain-containing protein, partial [Vicinamibacteria bacterium]|nr:GWxTD domain-containing protein [Vicinamibacteria bacterium]